MDSKKSNKIADIVQLQRMLKKWRRLADSSKNNNTHDDKSGNKSIKFIKRTLSFNSSSTSSALGGASSDAVPKGCLAVSVGEEMKKYVIPTDYLSHQAFQVLLRDAEEEFGFQQEGILRIPCEVDVFESILKAMRKKEHRLLLTQEFIYSREDEIGCGSSESHLSQSHHTHSPMCR